MLNNALDTERKWINELIHKRKMIDEVENLWDYPIDRMNVAQLQSLKKVLKELKKPIARCLDRFVIEGAPTQIQP
jgi:hypothetical protein